MYSPTLSLSDPPSESPISNAIAWVDSVALGTIATSVAVVAIATIGLLMLSGKLELRRSFTVVLGCFIVFGANGIASSLIALATPEPQQRRQQDVNPDRLSHQLQSSKPPPAVYDPYAGAAMPITR